MERADYTREGIDRWLAKLDDRVQSRLRRFRIEMEEEGLRSSTVRTWLSKARVFLGYLADRSKEPEDAGPSDIVAFVRMRLRICRRRRGSPPAYFVGWRCSYTGAIQRLLRNIQGQWPPTTAWTSRLERYRAHLLKRGLNKIYVRELYSHARQFLQYIDKRRLAIEDIQQPQVTRYFSFVARKNQRKPSWMAVHQRSVQDILRYVQGEWPPGSTPSPSLLQFKSYLQQQRFYSGRVTKHVTAVRQFLDYLREQDIVPEKAQLKDLHGFVELKQRQYRRRHGAPPNNMSEWRIRYTAAIRRFMRMIDPHWPPPKEPANENERFQTEVCERYIHWMDEVRGLSKATVVKYGDEARQFLNWLGNRTDAETLRYLNVADIDRYLASRMPGLRWATRASICACMRSFLRYLRAEAWIDRDLFRFVSGPPVYAFAEIPRAFTEEQIRRLLHTVRADRRPAGLRDYAILMLLATYGIRGGEVVHLRLEDIDWRENRIRVRQSKSGRESHLPLVTPVGNALLDYLRRGRPQSEAREVFLTVQAPYGPLASSGCLVAIIRDRLKQAGIAVEGRHGAHAFRFARAASLLRASVSLKQIGDLLGHQSARATGIYLRLAVDDLRAISLEVPGGQNHGPLA